MNKPVISTPRGQQAGRTSVRLSSPFSPGLAQHVRRIISRRKGIRLGRLHLNTSLAGALAFDTVDLVDIILEVERHFHLIIPDEVPLHTVGDLVSYVGAHQLQAAYAVAA